MVEKLREILKDINAGVIDGVQAAERACEVVNQENPTDINFRKVMHWLQAQSEATCAALLAAGRRIAISQEKEREIIMQCGQAVVQGFMWAATKFEQEEVLSEESWTRHLGEYADELNKECDQKEMRPTQVMARA